MDKDWSIEVNEDYVEENTLEDILEELQRIRILLEKQLEDNPDDYDYMQTWNYDHTSSNVPAVVSLRNEGWEICKIFNDADNDIAYLLRKKRIK